ncbi:cytochrome bd-I oxidase subunit CydX [Xenorhabdus thuongxuanensis]|uniref:Cyd operon protein YbgT n=1 Tax=Xenorhabdus thuongxuanensis TaxID=1873484 RepID=A0A1Q5U9H9_9GAMM|nr:cytochrome bd-I oxidase subunit CydX [Xenorhabdus thuongxuanensis]OKP09121.1 cyd operon protein YbgT [Xenorhabdus thuongxuanensis]
MWYFAWILGTLLACSFAVIAALALEHSESQNASESDKNNVG